MTRVQLQLKGEETPRPCYWLPESFTQFADFDLAVGGVAHLDLGLFWHMAALLWACCEGARDQWTLQEFAERLPWGPESRDRLYEGVRLLWQQIT